MSDEPDYLICNGCESPCYMFELDRKGEIASALCQLCGEDDPKEFRPPEVEDLDE